MLMMMSSLTRRSRSSAPPLLQSTPRRNLSLSTAMGQQFSMSAPPAGAHVMALEERGTCGGCGPRKWDPACRQPPAASGWSADRWQTFALEMGELVKGYRRDGYACYAMLLIPAGVGLMLISLSTGLGSEKCEPPPPAPPPPSTPYGSPEDGKPVPWDGCRGFNFMYLIHFPFILIAIIVFFCCLYHTKPNNQRVDGLITDLCRRSRRPHARATLRSTRRLCRWCCFCLVGLRCSSECARSPSALDAARRSPQIRRKWS